MGVSGRGSFVFRKKIKGAFIAPFIFCTMQGCTDDILGNGLDRRLSDIFDRIMAVILDLIFMLDYLTIKLVNQCVDGSV